MEHLDVGKKGEDIACGYLKTKGHSIIDRNFRMKFGEIDVVSEKNGTVFFTEVKTITSKGGPSPQDHRPEENVSPWKLKKLSRVVQVYLMEKYADPNKDWDFLVIAIVLDIKKRTARVRVINEVLS